MTVAPSCSTMNHLEGQSEPYTQYNDFYNYKRTPQIISTIALLLLGYYVLSFFDAWPSTTKRTVYELTIRSIPSRLIYLLQNAMMHFGRLSEQESSFRHEDLGDFRAKEEALQRIFGNSPIPNVLHRARTLSGYDKFLPVSKELGPPGLGNWDNSCYQNSILQGLASMPAFQHYVHRSLLLCEKTRTQAKTTNALATFIDELAVENAHRQTLWTPKVLKSMDSWQQQDAQEYFSRVLEAVEKEATQYAKIISRTANLGLGCLRIGDSASDTDKENMVRKLLQTLVGNPVDGLLAQALTCQTCGFSEGVSLNQFNCLTLNLGLGGSRSIENLLDEYTEPELIEGVECDNCTRIVNNELSPEEETLDENAVASEDQNKVKKELRVKAKQITFGRLPKDLVIHVNRSIWDDYGNQIKNPSFVEFPARLDISGQWCAPLEAGFDTVKAMYELKCIVTHSGRHDNGHYVAYGKRDKDWYCFNDEIVTKLSEQQVLTRGNVFMLFYEGIDHTELMSIDHDEIFQAEASTAEEAASPSTSSAESETYDEPMTEPLQVSVPVIRIASGGVHTHENDNSPGRAFVPAV